MCCFLLGPKGTDDRRAAETAGVSSPAGWIKFKVSRALHSLPAGTCKSSEVLNELAACTSQADQAQPTL